MLRLLPLIILAVLVLVIILVIRARQANRRKRALDRGWYASQLDTDRGTLIQLCRYGRKPQTMALIYFDDPCYSDRVIEEYAATQVKADDRNSTNKAIAEAS